MSDETVDSLAATVRGTVIGDGRVRIRGVADLRAAGPEEIGFVRDPKYAPLASASAAGAVIVTRELELPMAQIVVEDAAVAFAKIAGRFHPPPRALRHAVHATAVVGEGSELAEPVRIGPRVAVGAGCRIGPGSVLAAGVVIGDRVRVGRDCVIHPNAVIEDDCQLGDRVTVHAGVVIGADGFGYVRDGVEWIRVPQLGDVIIEDDVEIGANSTIDRGALGSTRIGRGTKLDNLVHVGHNCVFGEHCIVAALSAFSGSTVVGARCTIGGHVVTKGHQRIADDVRIGGASGVHRDLPEAGDYMGYPIQEKRQWARTLFAIERLSETTRSVRELERRAQAADAEPPPV